MVIYFEIDDFNTILSIVFCSYNAKPTTQWNQALLCSAKKINKCKWTTRITSLITHRKCSQTLGLSAKAEPIHVSSILNDITDNLEEKQFIEEHLEKFGENFFKYMLEYMDMDFFKSFLKNIKPRPAQQYAFKCNYNLKSSQHNIICLIF